MIRSKIEASWETFIIYSFKEWSRDGFWMSGIVCVMLSRGYSNRMLSISNLALKRMNVTR
jgi:hypothetical protein